MSGGLRATTRSRRRSAAPKAVCSSPTATIATRRRSPTTGAGNGGVRLRPLGPREPRRRRAGDPAHAPARLRRATRARQLLPAHGYRAERRSRNRGARRSSSRDHPAFVLLRRDSAQLAESEGAELDTAVIDRLPLEDVRYTPSAVAAEEAVRSGRADAAFLVRAPTLDQVTAVARARRAAAGEDDLLLPKADERPRLLALRRMTDWLGLLPADRGRPGRRPRRAPHEARAGAGGRRGRRRGRDDRHRRRRRARRRRAPRGACRDRRRVHARLRGAGRAVVRRGRRRGSSSTRSTEA